jgi:multiple sugar transport system substrate-binding protein
LQIVWLLLAMAYTKYPQACKALMAFLLEADQFNKLLHASQGFFSHPLNAFAAKPVWTEDPKRTVFCDIASRSLTVGGLGSVSENPQTPSSSSCWWTCS